MPWISSSMLKILLCAAESWFLRQGLKAASSTSSRRLIGCAHRQQVHSHASGSILRPCSLGTNAGALDCLQSVMHCSSQLAQLAALLRGGRLGRFDDPWAIKATKQLVAGAFQLPLIALLLIYKDRASCSSALGSSPMHEPVHMPICAASMAQVASAMAAPLCM